MTKLAQQYFDEKGWCWFLQGSRSKTSWFSGICDVEGSDWDYFLDELQHIRSPGYEELIKDGWTELSTEAYQDLSTLRVFEKQFPDGKVQVSIRKNFLLMCEAWSKVDPDFYWKYLNKRSKGYLGKEFVRDFMDNLYTSQF